MNREPQVLPAVSDLGAAVYHGVHTPWYFSNYRGENPYPRVWYPNGYGVCGYGCGSQKTHPRVYLCYTLAATQNPAPTIATVPLTDDRT
jgi:hypothetical protein